MVGRYGFYMDMADEWYTAAYGYSKDDDRYHECMEKVFKYQKLAQKYNTKEYAALSYANEVEFEKFKILENALVFDGWTEEEIDALLKIHESVEDRWKKSCDAMEDYHRKVEG